MYIDLNDKIDRFVVQEYVNKIYHFSSDQDLHYNVHKLIHTFYVVEMAQKLIQKTRPKLPIKIQRQILNAAVLHDVGRCYEWKNGKRLKNFDHGKVGADLIKKYFPKLATEELVTLYHNKLPSNKDPKSCSLVLNYVRDADMLANLEYQLNHMEIWLAHLWNKSSRQLCSLKIDEEILNAVREHRACFTPKLKNHGPVEICLWQLCWRFNFRTQVAQKIALKENVFIRFRDLLCQKIIPLVVTNKKDQKKLIQDIYKIFPDDLLQ